MLALASCSSGVNGDNTPPADSLASSATIVDTASKVELSGLYCPSKFLSCDNTASELTVSQSTPFLDSIYNKLNADGYPGKTIFVRFQGIQKGSALQIDTVFSAETKNYQNDCVPFTFWCNGNEPFWQCEISEKEKLIDLYLPMEQRTEHFPFVAAAENENKLIFKTSNEHNNLTVSISKVPCSDGMSERSYSYKTEVMFNEQLLQGCATRWNEKQQTN